MAIQELEGNQVRVTMSARHWKFLQELERSYKIAKSIARGAKNCQVAPKMSVSSAMDYIDSL